MKKARDGRENITTIIHDLKESYSRAFHEPFPSNDRAMENVLISTARKVKRGYDAFWYTDKITNNKSVKFEKYRPQKWIKIPKKFSDFE